MARDLLLWRRLRGGLRGTCGSDHRSPGLVQGGVSWNTSVGRPKSGAVNNNNNNDHYSSLIIRVSLMTTAAVGAMIMIAAIMMVMVSKSTNHTTKSNANRKPLKDRSIERIAVIGMTPIIVELPRA